MVITNGKWHTLIAEAGLLVSDRAPQLADRLPLSGRRRMGR